MQSAAADHGQPTCPFLTSAVAAAAAASAVSQGLGNLLATHMPEYGNLISSHKAVGAGTS